MVASSWPPSRTSGRDVGESDAGGGLLPDGCGVVFSITRVFNSVIDRVRPFGMSISSTCCLIFCRISFFAVWIFLLVSSSWLCDTLLKMSAILLDLPEM